MIYKDTFKLIDGIIMMILLAILDQSTFNFFIFPGSDFI